MIIMKGCVFAIRFTKVYHLTRNKRITRKLVCSEEPSLQRTYQRATVVQCVKGAKWDSSGSVTDKLHGQK